MKPKRLLHAGLLVVCVTAGACTEDVGICQGILQGRDTVRVQDTVLYGGQAIMNKACAVGCHSSKATGEARHGVPAGLDFDLSPIDQEDTAGTRTRGKVTVVKLTNAQVTGLRARQKKIVEQRDVIWQQIEDGLMPPSGMLDAVMDSIFASSEKTPCERGKPYSMITPGKTREVLRNWLACGAPLVETSSPKVDKSVATPGSAGYQYRVCEDPPEVITLERLFVTTLGDCGGCHNNTASPPPKFASVQVLEETLRTGKSCRGKPFVTPFEPDESYLLDLLKGPDPECENDQMPEGDPLSERGIAEVEAWIAAGAPTTASDVTSPTSQDVDNANDDDDDGPPDVSSDDEEPDAPKEEQERTPIRDAGASRDAGAAKDAGVPKDAGRDAGNDAGRAAGR